MGGEAWLTSMHSSIVQKKKDKEEKEICCTDTLLYFVPPSPPTLVVRKTSSCTCRVTSLRHVTLSRSECTGVALHNVIHVL